MMRHVVHSSGYNNPVPATDAIIEYNSGIVLVTRKNPPHGLALPGGFAEAGLTLKENARKEVFEETGLVFVSKGQMPFGLFDDPERDPRGHVISVTYSGRGYGRLKPGDDAAGARVYSIGEIRHLAIGGSIDGLALQFDHAKILSEYLARRAAILAGKPFGRAGTIGRFRPPHNGSAALLETICEQADHVVIGIGSANRHDKHNPFDAEKTSDMIEGLLSGRFSNYAIIAIPDYGHLPEFRDGKKWAEEVVKAYGTLDAFVSGNNYAQELLSQHYAVVSSFDLVPKEKTVVVDGTTVRTAMAIGGEWKHLVPGSVADYLERNGLVERFRREFGLETLAEANGTGPHKRDAAEEKLRINGSEA